MVFFAHDSYSHELISSSKMGIRSNLDRIAEGITDEKYKSGISFAIFASKTVTYSSLTRGYVGHVPPLPQSEILNIIGTILLKQTLPSLSIANYDYDNIGYKNIGFFLSGLQCRICLPTAYVGIGE